MTDDDSGREPHERYKAAMRRLQTIVKFTLLQRGYYEMPGARDLDDHEASPKRMRVGVDGALAFGEALADLLVEKGLVTRDELVEAMAHSLEARVDARELEVRAVFPNVRFE